MAVGECTALLTAEERPARGCFWTTAWLIGSAGLGYAADGYDFFNIDLVMAIIEREYPGQMEPKQKSLTVSSCIIGVIAGQLFFGYLGDKLGRRGIGITCALLQMAGALLSAFCSDRLGIGLATQLAFCRLILGIGAGGEFPLAGTISVEGYSSPSFMGRIIGSPFQLLVVTSIMYETGMLFASLLVLILMSTGMHLDTIWRVSLAAGALPASIAAVLRWLMEESKALETSARAEEAEELAEEAAETASAGSLEAAVRPRKSRSSGTGFWARIPAQRLWLLLAASIAWACSNAVVFGHGSFKSVIAETYFGTAGSVRDVVHRNAMFGLMMTVAMAVADFLLVTIVDRLSCRLIVMVGFTGVLVCSLISAVSMCIWHEAAISGLLLMITFLASFSWGPMKVGSKSLVPMNVPASIRSTFTGIAGASAKTGALLGCSLFPVAEAAFGLPAVMFTTALVAVVGIVAAALGFPTIDADPRELDKKKT